ncbi:hypothetical protein Zmor_011344 [Zophobas morio]|uniref:Uncharacterized protein n=1 Tax=Zophobas morio TaxID=2755281 RepID=A0AA38IV04_9CUCU|nr:hypothetical protein Zmor_011344 [Zophobas morio]
MESLSGSLSVNITESQQLRVILRNISLFHQEHLALVNVDSKDVLLKYGCRLETRRARMENFVPPPSHKALLLEPDLSFVAAEIE